MSGLRLRNVRKAFGASIVLADINLDIADGEFVVFVGPSGCGKSTLLRLIAGLEDVTSGEIWIGSRLVNDMVPAQRGVPRSPISETIGDARRLIMPQVLSGR